MSHQSEGVLSYVDRLCVYVFFVKIRCAYVEGFGGLVEGGGDSNYGSDGGGVCHVGGGAVVVVVFVGRHAVTSDCASSFASLYSSVSEALILVCHHERDEVGVGWDVGGRNPLYGLVSVEVVEFFVVGLLPEDGVRNFRAAVRDLGLGVVGRMRLSAWSSWGVVGYDVP